MRIGRERPGARGHCVGEAVVPVGPGPAKDRRGPAAPGAELVRLPPAPRRASAPSQPPPRPNAALEGGHS